MSVDLGFLRVLPDQRRDALDLLEQTPRHITGRHSRLLPNHDDS
jgi:hypothetical protein